ncbi:uncharacterized protein [Anabrus simplex]|uniref:uncharacterized protein isoform X2 n=1 Tax=Anabrus simplex TaxID=316456 RepID=UPI0035A29F17
MGSLQNRENPNGSLHFSNHTMVYVDLKAAGLGSNVEIFQIGAHYAGNSFTRQLCPNGIFRENTAKPTELSKKDGIFNLGGEQVETVSKMDAWKDFLKFLQSANNSVVLVTHNIFNTSDLLFRDLSELSLMIKFRKVCAGVIDSRPLCTRVFPGRYELGKKYKLKELVEDELGEEYSSHNATVNAIYLEKLMKYANVQSEMFQQHFITFSDLEYRYHLKMAKRAAKARMNFSGEDSSASLLPCRVKARKNRSNRKKTSAATPDVGKQVPAKMMTTKDSLQNDENPNGSQHFPDCTMVYFNFNGTGLQTGMEVYQIGAHFAEKSFSRYVCPTFAFSQKTAKRTGLSKKDGVLYLEGERVETVSKADAWKDFLKFLQSANKSVVLVTHGRLHDCSLLFRDLSELSLMEEFRKVCLGVVDTHPLCQNIFPARKESGKNYGLKELVQDNLGEENSSRHCSATVDAINLKKLMKYAKVEPEMFQQYFFSLADLEYRRELKRKNLLRKEAKRAAKARMTFNDENQTSSMENGENSDSPLLSDVMKARNRRSHRKKTRDVSKQAKKMTVEDSLQNSDYPNGNYDISDHTMVYIDLKSTGCGRYAEIFQIGAHFAENSFSRYVCPNRTFGKKAEKQTELSKKDGILHLRGERVQTVSKMDAWKDFLKFLRSANNSVVLVIHGRYNDCLLLFRDLSELSLMEEFSKVCVGVVDTLLLCKNIFPERRKIGKEYELKELLEDKLNEEDSDGYDCTVNAINLERLMKYANVEPEMFQKYFFLLSNLEHQVNRWQARLQRKSASRYRNTRNGINLNGDKRNSTENEEDSLASLDSGVMKARNPKGNRKKTPDVTKQVAAKKMTTKDSLQTSEDPNRSHHLPDHKMVYFDLAATRLGRNAEVCQIQAHFAEKSFSRCVCPIGIFGKKAAKLNKFSKQDGILYLRGEMVETVSKEDAWKDFLNFLQIANNSVVLVLLDRYLDYFLLFRDLSKLSLFKEFRKVCIGVIDMFPLFRKLLPGREKTANKYKLKKLVQGTLAEENSSGCHSARVDVMYLEKLMKHAKVKPEILQQHFFSLFDLECEINRETKLLNMRITMAKSAKRAKRENRRSSVECGGEDSGASRMSGRVNARKPIVYESADTSDVSKQGKKMTAKDSLQNSGDPKGSHHFSGHTMVYFDLEGTGSEGYSEVCQIGAHFAENNFSRYVCPIRNFTKVASELTGFSKKDGILYLRGEQVETVSKMHAWKDFLKFLQSTNNSVVLVMHDRRNDCSLMLRDLSDLSLIEEFRKVCAGVIDTLPLCQQIFPGRNEIGKKYRLEDIVQDILGEETSAGSHNALDDAINLEKLVKHANVQPEEFQQHFFSLSDVEYWYQTREEAKSLWIEFSFMSLHSAKKMAEAGVTYNDLVRSYIDDGEDGVAALLSSKMKFANSDPKAIRQRTIDITNVLRESVCSGQTTLTE